MVEFALVFPIFILLVMGIVDFGRAVWIHNAMANMSAEGARYGIIRSHTDTQIYNQTIALAPTNEFQASCNASVPDRVCITPSGTRTPDQPITVEVHYRFIPITPLIANVIGGNGYIDMTSVSKMTVEY